MAEAFVGFTADGNTATENAVLLLDAVEELEVSVNLVRTVENGFMVPEAVADEAGLPRYPQADCEECE